MSYELLFDDGEIVPIAVDTSVEAHARTVLNTYEYLEGEVFVLRSTWGYDYVFEVKNQKPILVMSGPSKAENDTNDDLPPTDAA
jgi:hypothetical protein